MLNLCLLQMRLDEPERLIQCARDAGEKIGGIGVADLIGSVDGSSR